MINKKLVVSQLLSYEVLVAGTAEATLVVAAVVVVAAPRKLNPALVVAEVVGAPEAGATRGVTVVAGAACVTAGLVTEVVAAPNESPAQKIKQ